MSIIAGFIAASPAQSILTFLGIVNTPIAIQLFALSFFALLIVVGVFLLLDAAYFFWKQWTTPASPSTFERHMSYLNEIEANIRADTKQTRRVRSQIEAIFGNTQKKPETVPPLSPSAARAAEFQATLKRMDAGLEELDDIFKLLPEVIASEVEQLEQNKKQTDAEIEVLQRARDCKGS